jgi:cytochrome c biogenesis protein CcmG/thiol:disulfide interchange protein DsbE
MTTKEGEAVPAREDGGRTARPGLLGLGIGPLLVVVAVVLLLVIVGLGLVRAQEGPVGVGSTAPEFTLTTFEGEQISLAALRGQVVVVNFWASWCKPCEQEAAELEQAWRGYREHGVVFLGVNYVDTEPEARAYMEKFDISYPSGPDVRTRISQAFRILGVPETYVIDADGRITSVKKGPYSSLGEIESAIELALQP